MKHILAALALLIAATGMANAQSYSGTFPANSAGQNVGGVNATAWIANTPTKGFGGTSYSAIVGAGTSQATATVIPTSNVTITACPAGAGVVLPNLEHFAQILIMNRSGAACLVYATPNGTVETTPGTASGVNGSASMASNATTVFKMVGPTTWQQ